MGEIAHKFRSDLPVHVMNDPAVPGGDDRLSALLSSKVQEARQARRIRLAWFGVGDNSYFPIGLSDLATCGPVLDDFCRGGYELDLTVLTNARALDPAGLALLAQLPVIPNVEEWSEEAERDLLGHALVALLPVNAQPFSVAKSLNRAVTAMSAGCQLLSIGYPLYEPFDALIYRDAATLLSDLGQGTMRFSGHRLEVYRATLDRVASPGAEARGLAEFLRKLATATNEPLPLNLIHGHSTRAEAHHMVRSLGGLSVASPFCTAVLDFDVIFEGSFSGPRMFVSRQATRRLLPNVRRQLKGQIKVRGEDFLHLPGPNPPSATIDRGGLPISFQIAVYRTWMREIERQMAAAFGPSRSIHSEISSLFPALVWAA